MTEIVKNPKFVAKIVKRLKRKKRVKITGLGIFEVVKCKGFGKKTLNGKIYTVGDYKKIKFKPAIPFKRHVIDEK